jgi:hypothetical protein
MRLEVLFVLMGCALSAAALPSELLQNSINSFTPELRALWDQAMKAFNAHQYADALPQLK